MPFPATISFQWGGPDGRCMECVDRFIDKDGYPRFKIKGKAMSGAKYMWVKLYGDVPDGIVVRHVCDNPLCINPDHLIVGTQAENIADRVERDRSARGEENGRAILTARLVGIIRKRLERGETLASVAERYGVTIGAISNIKYGRNWKHVA